MSTTLVLEEETIAIVEVVAGADYINSQIAALRGGASTSVTIASLAAGLAALTAGAPTLVDTFLEVYNRLLTDESAAAALTTTVSGKLAKASNLSDVTDPAAARANLGAVSDIDAIINALIFG